ncbi:hypothetical protein [Sphingorhabdus sp.]|uniref:DUF6915 family protein n=1 Tax=Sphingorhabdus sp. TaxID=1902408 RepID=UPI00334139A0
MAHPYHHAVSSARKWGGVPADYQAIHDFFDGSKEHMADFRHRAIRHHTEGIFMAERIFGVTIVNSAGRVVPVRYIGEQHVKEDLGRIPTVADWLSNIKTEGWMLGRGKSLERELEDGNLQVQDVGAEAAH